MRALSLSLVVLSCLTSCGVEPNEESAPVAKRDDALVSLSTPVEFTRLRALVPSTGLQSCYAYVVADPRAPQTDFLAWGFDPATGQALFFVHGNTTESLGAFNAMLTSNLAGYLHPSSDLGFFHGIVNNVPKTPPPPPPGGDFAVLSRQALGATQAIRTAHVNTMLH